MFFFFFLIGKFLSPLGLEPRTSHKLFHPLPFKLGLKGKVLHVLLETFYNVEGLVG